MSTPTSCPALSSHRFRATSTSPHAPPISRQPGFLGLVGFGIFFRLILFSNSAVADGMVTSCDQSALETALAGGGHVSFSCSGVIMLTTPISITADTILDGIGQSITISGNDSVRLFNVGGNVSFSLIHLTLAHGNHTGAPGDGQNAGGTGYGGAVFLEGGALHATDCQFVTNRASGGTGTGGLDAGDAHGGAIYTRAGAVNLTNCTFISNQAIGGGVHPMLGSGRGGAGVGGAIYVENGTLLAKGTRLFGNTARGGVTDLPGGSDGPAFGGAVYSTNGTVECHNCEVSTNQTMVGLAQRNTAPAATGGRAVYADRGSLILVESVFSENECHGDQGLGGATEGNGGSIFNLANLSIRDFTFSNNRAVGGPGRSVSSAGNGGAIYNTAQATIAGASFQGNSAIGGHGYGDLNAPSAGADGRGGAIYSTGQVAFLNCTLFDNDALGGDGANFAGLPQTDGGSGQGGGVYAAGGSLAMTNLTYAANEARGGKGGISRSDGEGFGGAIVVSPGAGAAVVNTILANSPPGGNVYGILTDGGHNICSDATGGFVAASSLSGTDPKLGPFGSYGGPTATIPLLAGSPAIDAGDALACPAVDQRGTARPYAAGCDIGAFESAPPYTINGHIRGYRSPDGVAVNVDSNSVPVDASGFYSFTGLAAGNYLVTPVAAGTRFVPGRRLVPVGPDSTDVDFEGYKLNALAVEPSAYGDYRIIFAGDFEGDYRTESTTNLVDWWPYSTNRTDTNGVFVITNIYSSSGPSTFLRVAKP